MVCVLEKGLPTAEVRVLGGAQIRTLAPRGGVMLGHLFSWKLGGNVLPSASSEAGNDCKNNGDSCRLAQPRQLSCRAGTATC